MAASIANELMEFQSTLPRRERLQEPAWWIMRSQFQSTLPRRERPLPLLIFWLIRAFQSTLPRRERPSPRKFSIYVNPFQSTLPRRERLLISWHTGDIFSGFNPRSRVGSDYAYKDYGTENNVSIHAPA